MNAVVAVIPVPGVIYRHFKGTTYSVLELIPFREGPTEPELYEVIDTETEEIYSVRRLVNSRNLCLRNDDGGAVLGTFVIYTSTSSEDVLTWARPIKSWISPVPPKNFFKRFLFKLGLAQGKLRFTPLKPIASEES